MNKIFWWKNHNSLIKKQRLNYNSKVDYIKKLEYIHNAEDFRGGTYKLPSGVILTGSVNCELPEHTHREIVDLAVLIASGEIQSPGYELNMNFFKH